MHDDLMVMVSADWAGAALRTASAIGGPAQPLFSSLLGVPEAACACKTIANKVDGANDHQASICL